MKVLVIDDEPAVGLVVDEDRKSTRLNSSHVEISYAVFCLKKKKKIKKMRALLIIHQFNYQIPHSIRYIAVTRVSILRPPRHMFPVVTSSSCPLPVSRTHTT